MPKSRTRGKNGKRKYFSPADNTRVQSAYLKKIEEYEAMELDALEVLEKSKEVKGTYLKALVQVILTKTKKKLENDNIDHV